TSHRPSGSATASSATSTRWGLDTTRAGRRPPSSLIQTPVSVARYTRWGVTGSNATAYTRGSTSSDRHVTPPSRLSRSPPAVAASHRSGTAGSAARRSEEHTSELQSRENLVCRLLLEITNG